MHPPQRAERYSPQRTWGIILVACVALIATSAPDTAIVSDSVSDAAVDGAVDFVVSVSEDGVCESTSMQVSFTVKSMLTQEELTSGAPEVVARLIPDDGSLNIVEAPLTLPQNGSEQLAAEGFAEVFAACPEDEACDLGFRFELVPDRSYDVTLTGDIFNDSPGCPISNPSYSDDATVEVAFE